MCRRNQLLGCSIAALGVGVLIGTWIESGFFGHLLGLFAICIGLTVCRKK